MVRDQDLLSIQEARDGIAAASLAQKMYASFTQEQVDRIVEAIAQAAYKQAENLAILAVTETKMGIIEHKKMKNELASQGVYEAIRQEKTVGIIYEDRVAKQVEMAYPFGVIAAVTPVTNPTATAIFKTLIALKAQNAIVFSPHPTAVNCTIEALKICQQAAVHAGAPEGLIQWISHPTIKGTEELMHHRDVQLILATGGAGLVKAAYSSGKPAYGVGPGNVPVYIDRTANVNEAMKRIIDSKSFDNSTICATEQAIVVHQEVKAQVMAALAENGAILLSGQNKEKLAKVISPVARTLNSQIVGKPATVIAQMANIEVPPHTRVLVAEEHEIGKEFPFSMEKLSPILGLYTAQSQEEAVKICHRLLDVGGRGHSLAIHAQDEHFVKQFAAQMPVSRILVNTLASVGAAGGTTSLPPSFTLGCGAYGGNITSDNISARHLVNKKRVAYEVKALTIPPPQHPQNIQAPSMQANEGASIDRLTIEKIVEKVLTKLSN
ncbi:aldehyde dehydrogenase family protein [Lysinibacillus fusiformis]|uniref:aldehyde dehydrogenase family protein n=1 Tax=Lysinibacillus fusiformis TaxID=28031 RepID=UPI0019684A2C|nr:aldehyde dehydrogenase family protein [Lysinibacillus fusiformis]QSB09000.1 aldehyde dehydrogenase family protein [Lysinibacillus fusiformis]